MPSKPTPPSSSPSSSVDSTSPERLGVYRIESLLGRGGMGEVYLAWDEVLERHVAIKRIRSDWLGEAHHRARFLREARAVARLDHPAIVRIHHVLERDESPCLVMEYVRGQDLGKLIARGRIDAARAMAIARGVADGLAEAHRQGLVHRDLKPGNVMLTQDAAPSGGVKILDFGLAKAFWSRADGPEEGAAAEDDRLTRSGMIVGTVHTMSPEQAAGEPVDHRSDLFALGCLLYEMLSGRSPFRGKHVMETLGRIYGKDPEPLGDSCPGLPRGLIDLVERLLAKDPDQRPHSADRVARELAALAAGSGGDLGSVGPTGPRPSIPSGPSLPHEDPSALADASTEVGVRPLPEQADPSIPVLRVLVLTDLVDSTKHLERLGDIRMAGLSERHDRMARDLLARHGGLEIDKTDGFLLLFERPGDAVAYALSYHQALHRLGQKEGVGLSARVGVHLGEVILRRNPAHDVSRGAKPLEVEGLAKPTAARIMSLAGARQTLLTRGVFDMARHAAAAGELADPALRWLDHGPYSLQGIDESLEVCEVGVEGFAPLVEPPDSDKAKRAVSWSDELTLGWRPAVGQPIPRRPNWQLTRRLGEGGFGEVWLARHETDEERVFKFCFEADHLQALKREVTLFRLLRETLGHRHDIARVLDWDFDEAPYFLESEFTDGGDLVTWAESLGGLASVPLPRRLELVAGVADALAAAHSVGILHKDVKPANVLVSHDADGRPRARLTDFGIGALAKGHGLGEPGFTIEGLTETSLDGGTSATGGTVRYMAPELLEGKPATLQADVYSLGVVLYQAVVGDFERALAPGWRRQIDDQLLREDIAACVDGLPERRLHDAGELAERLRTLGTRHEQRRVEEQAERSRRRALRLRRAAGWLGIAAIVLLVVISVFAYQTAQARDREARARENAEQRRRQAEKLIDFMLGDLRSELQPLGKLEILDKVGDQAMEYFAGVPEGDLSDEETASYARALDQIGQVRFALGEMDEAALVFRQSLVLTRELVARNPEDPDVRFQLGQSHFWVGYSHWGARDFEAALEQFEAYRDISEKLVEEDPESFDWQRELAYSYSNLGQAFEELGRLTEASRALEANARILEGLSLDRPDDRSLTTSLSNAYAKIGRIAEIRGQLPRARLRQEASLALVRKASAAHPNDMDLRLSLNKALFEAGRILHLQGEPTRALESYVAALEISRQMVAHEPTNQEWITGLALDLGQTARLLLDLGDSEGASRLVDEGTEIAESLVRATPDHPDLLFSSGFTSWVRAALEMRRGRLSSARQGFRSAEELLQLLSRESDSLIDRFWLVRTLEKLGETHQRLGDSEQAAEAWNRGLLMARDLVAAVPSPDHLDALVRLLVLTENNEEAAPFVERLAAMGYRHPAYLDFLARHGVEGRALGES